MNVKEMIESLGYEANESSIDQFMAMLYAFEVYAERNARHADTWMDSGWRGALFDVRKKIDRLWNEYMTSDNPPEDLDSAIDAINYLCFFIRGRLGEIEGTWRWK